MDQNLCIERIDGKEIRPIAYTRALSLGYPMQRKYQRKQKIQHKLENSEIIYSKLSQKQREILFQKFIQPKKGVIPVLELKDEHQNNGNMKILSAKRKQVSASLAISTKQINNEEVLNLKRQLKKKEQLIKYLERKLGHQIIKSMTKLNEKIEKLEKQNIALSNNLQILQKNSIKYLKSPHWQGSSSTLSSLYNDKERTPPKRSLLSKYALSNQMTTNKILNNSNKGEKPHFEVQTETIQTSNQQIQSEQDINFKELETENVNLKKLIENLNIEIEYLKDQFIGLKSKVKICFDSIQKINSQETKTEEIEYPYKAKTQIQQNYLDILSIFEVEWEYFQKPKDVHEILLMEVRNLQKQNKILMEKFKKVNTESKNSEKERKTLETSLESERILNFQISKQIEGLTKALHENNQAIIRNKLSSLNSLFQQNQDIELNISDDQENERQNNIKS